MARGSGGAGDAILGLVSGARGRGGAGTIVVSVTGGPSDTNGPGVVEIGGAGATGLGSTSAWAMRASGAADSSSGRCIHQVAAASARIAGTARAATRPGRLPPRPETDFTVGVCGRDARP